jgi:hypothetical protein
MANCKECNCSITSAEQLTQYERLVEYGWSEQEAKAIMPRCEECVTKILWPGLVRKANESLLPSLLHLVANEEKTVYLIVDTNEDYPEQLKALSFDPDFITQERIETAREFGHSIIAIEKLY